MADQSEERSTQPSVAHAQPENGSPFLALPPEIKLLILTASIRPAWGPSEAEAPRYRSEPFPYLSHTIPKALLLVSKHVRAQAFNALAASAGLTVVCNVTMSGEVYPGWTSDGADPTQFGPPPDRNTLLSYAKSGRRDSVSVVWKQCEKLLVPNGRELKLCIKLHMDGDGAELPLVDELEAVRHGLIIDVFNATEFWPEWGHVELDLKDTDESMTLRENPEWHGVPDDELDEYIEKGWIALVEELQPLRAKTKSFDVKLQGWPVDDIVKQLEKAPNVQSINL